MKTKSFQDLADDIISRPSKFSQKIVAIDGGGGAGKSTFAKRLQELIPNSAVIHGDDFYKGPWDKRLDHTNYVVNPMFDWDRYQSEVLDAVRDGKLVQYHVYDWHKHLSEEVVSVPQGATVIVEGGYVTQKNFADSYDFKIWIEADMNLRLEKALVRDGEHMRYLWEEDWLPVERNFIEKDNPASRADLIVKGHAIDFSEGTFEVA
jgi:uridine kinase